MSGAAILTDLTRCTGCEACSWACKEANRLKRTEPTQLDESTFTRVQRIGEHNVRRQCMHCEQPACESVCPVGALRKTEAGPVTYDVDKCIGCRYCMVACPFGVPKYEWNTAVPRVRKCEMCHKKLAEGLQPACTTACPAGATQFGERDALLAEAHRRIEEHPGRYVNHVYGETEAGGTSVLYLSDVPFEKLGFPKSVQHSAYPQLTWNILSKLPPVVGTAGVSLVGLWWIIGRRQHLAERRAKGLED